TVVHVARDAHPFFLDDLEDLAGGITKLLVALGGRRPPAVLAVHPLQVGQDLARRAQKLPLVFEFGTAAGERLVLRLRALDVELRLTDVGERLLDFRGRELLEVVEQMLLHNPALLRLIANLFQGRLEVPRFRLSRLQRCLDRLQSSGLYPCTPPTGLSSWRSSHSSS